LIPNEIIRKAVKRSGISTAEIAWRLGWVEPARRGCAYIRADGNRVKRRLGMNPYIDRHGSRYSAMMQERTALKILEAIGIDPVDIDL
jgi:hypothetical protein